MIEIEPTKIRIYDTDPEVYARTTKISPQRTKQDIDTVLHKFDIYDIWWHYDPDKDKVELKFMLSEKFQGEDREIPFVLVPPTIWHKGRYDDDTINWKASMRNMYYYILTHLSQAYVNQFSKMTAFLPHMLTGNGILLKDRIHKLPLSLPETIGKVD